MGDTPEKEQTTSGQPADRRDFLRQIAKDGVLFDGYDFEPETQDSIFEFMETNQTRLREMSLRMALKIADLRKLSPGNWKRLSETTCMKAAD